MRCYGAEVGVVMWLITAAIGFVVAVFLRRLTRPRIAVAQVNGVWMATVTGVWSRREFVRTDRYDWIDIASGYEAGSGMTCNLDDTFARLVAASIAMERLHKGGAS